MTAEAIEWLTPSQVAALTQRHVQTVFAALRARELRGHQSKHRGHWRIDRADINYWVRGERPPLQIRRAG